MRRSRFFLRPIASTVSIADSKGLYPRILLHLISTPPSCFAFSARWERSDICPCLTSYFHSIDYWNDKIDKSSMSLLYGPLVWAPSLSILRVSRVWNTRQVFVMLLYFKRFSCFLGNSFFSFFIIFVCLIFSAFLIFTRICSFLFLQVTWFIPDLVVLSVQLTHFLLFIIYIFVF